MTDRRATRIVWAFLVGVIVAEGWAILMSFPPDRMFLTTILHYTFSPAGTPIAWASAVLLVVVDVALSASGSAVIRDHMLRPSTWGPYAAVCVLAVPMAVISGFFEEAFFRKFLMDWSMIHGQGVASQIVISALAFGAVHAVWGVAGGNLRAALNAMLVTGALGAALAIIYVVGGRSVAPCVAAHMAINFLVEPWLIITAATNGWRRARAAVA
jgi:membrane protease YdiL (CAAX protease family)